MFILSDFTVANPIEDIKNTITESVDTNEIKFEANSSVITDPIVECPRGFNLLEGKCIKKTRTVIAVPSVMCPRGLALIGDKCRQDAEDWF